MDVLDLMGLGKNSVMVVHGEECMETEEKTKIRWCEQFHKLPENVKKRLVLENCEKSFSIKDCLEVSNRINIPIVFDTHHFECYKLLHPNEDFEDARVYIPLILDHGKKEVLNPSFT